MRSPQPLFHEYDLRLVLEAQAKKLSEDIDRFEAGRLLNTDLPDLVKHFVDHHRVEAPQLLEESISKKVTEAKVDVSHDLGRLVLDRSRPAYVPGTKVEIFVPFDGDPNLLKCHPSSFSTAAPHGVVSGKEVVFTYERADHNADALKAAIDWDLKLLREWTGWVANDVKQFNDSLVLTARNRIEARRQRLQKDRETWQQLSFPERTQPEQKAATVAHRSKAVPTPQRKPGQIFEYDVALSFAGEERHHARALYEYLTGKGTRVFYDEAEKASLWGKNLYTHLHEVYSKRARFCVLFASKDYAGKMWTSHERRAAQERALHEMDAEYILPVRMDDTEIPGLPETVAYVRISEGVQAIGDMLLDKLKTTTPNRKNT